MGYNRMASFFSAAIGRISSFHSASRPPTSPDAWAPIALDVPSASQGSGLRLSMSLKDVSTTNLSDLEEGEFARTFLPHSKHVRSLRREVNGASFSKNKAPPLSSLERKKCLRAIIGLLCLILLLFVGYVVWNNYGHKTTHFCVVLDCGSTGTRAYVYQWSIEGHGHNHGFPVDMISLPKGFDNKSTLRSGRAYQRMETEPGLDKLVRNVSGLRASLNPLLRWAGMQVPNEFHRSTPLFLHATAGVRRLPSSDSSWLLDEAWNILKNSSFLSHRKWIKIITGVEEAYFGWIALNYHMGILGPLKKKPTLGSLDLGGSSLQVTFENNNPTNDSSSLKLSVGPATHQLTAYSLTGYGLNDAYDKSVAYLLRKLDRLKQLELGKRQVEIIHPCLQKSYEESYFCSSCIHNGTRPDIGKKGADKGKLGISVKLLGSSDWKNCRALARATVNLSEWSKDDAGLNCKTQPCALPDNLPHPEGKFYAMSGFFVVFRFFNLTSSSTLNELLLKGQKFCETEWELAKRSVIPQPFIEQYCFRAPYIVSLLRDGLHISDKRVVIGSGSVTWTLGVALQEAGNTINGKLDIRNYALLSSKLDNGIFICLLIFLSVLLVFALLCMSNLVPNSCGSCLPNSGRKANTNSVLTMTSPFNLRRWSPINGSDGRTKMPLSPTIEVSPQSPFDVVYGSSGSNIQLDGSSFRAIGGSIPQSYSSSSLGQIHFDNGTGYSWTPHRSLMQLQSRRSQSREDLSSSLSESHMIKV